MLEERSGIALGNHTPLENGLGEEPAAAWSHGDRHHDDVVALEAAPEDRFGDAVLAHQDHLAHIAYLIAGDVAIAETAVADAYARLWPKFDRGRIEPDRERRVLLREVIAEVREHTRRMRVTRPTAAADDEQARAWATFHQLPVEQRSALVLHHLQDLTLEETAEILGDSPATVEARVAAGVAEVTEGLGRGGPRSADAGG